MFIQIKACYFTEKNVGIVGMEAQITWILWILTIDREWQIKCNLPLCTVGQIDSS